MTAVKPDFEIIVRIAERMGYDVHKLVPFGPGLRADMGQSRGAQSAKLIGTRYGWRAWHRAQDEPV